MDIKQLLQTSQPGISRIAELLESKPSTNDSNRLFVKGQIIQAKVISVPTANTAEIQFNKQTLRAYTPTPLQQGQTLQLQVVSSGKLPALQILNELSTVETTNSKLISLLNQSRINQQAVGLAINNITTLSNKLADPSVNDIQKIASLLGHAIKHPADLSNPAELQRYIKDSGMLFDQKLMNDNSRSTSKLSGDLKFQLLLLANRLRQFSPEAKTPELRQTNDQLTLKNASIIEQILEQTTSALSRIQLLQSHSIRSENDPIFWHFELPVKEPNGQTQQIEVYIEQEQKNQQGDDAGWRIGLNFDFAETGEFSSRIYLSGDKLTINFWVQQSETRDLVENSIQQLRKKLHGVGFDVEALQVHAGSAPVIAAPDKQFGGMSLKA